VLFIDVGYGLSQNCCEQRNRDLKSCHLAFDMGKTRTCARFRARRWGSSSLWRFQSLVKNVISVNWIIFPELTLSLLVVRTLNSASSVWIGLCESHVRDMFTDIGWLLRAFRYSWTITYPSRIKWDRFRTSPSIIENIESRAENGHVSALFML
jgi:hypothetical protein